MKKTILLFISFLLMNTLSAQNENEELAKKLANPVASLISLPLQNNMDFGIGSLKGSRYTLNI
jgi:hypothetical protein